MKNSPEQQWSALSALYEEADALPPQALPGWLARLEAAGHPLLPQLKRMLEARAHLETDNFLGTLPKLLPRETVPGSDWAPGRRVGPYRLVRPLGEGGMAEVWLADRDDGILKRQAAIKLPYPRPGRESFAARFDRERNILATLRHPHIAALFDAGVTKEGQAWLALEYVEGQPIAAFCDERRLPLRERVMLFRQVLLAVQHAHANLVIHRDLKPANILVTPQGEARLLDFGIAKLLEAEGDAIAETELTRQAGRSMTLRYASPEQINGLPLTTACDVYSLGVVFYELMCGERPYDLKADSAARLEHAILEEDPKAPSRRTLKASAASARGTTVKGLRRTLSPELDAIALRCLAKKASARYSSVDALLADIDRWLAGEAVLARTPGAWYRFRKFAARHRVGVALGTGAIVSLAAVATIAVVLGFQARQESARAIAARDFMLTLFKRADQEKSHGNEITAREILDAGRKDLLTRLAGQPELQVELLQGIANIQRDMGEFASADSTYQDVVRVFDKLGRARDAALARMSHAEIVLHMGDVQRAETLLDGAKAMVVDAAQPKLTAQLRQIEGTIALSRGDARRARELFTAARREALAAYGADHLKSVEALRGLIVAEQRLRNFDVALSLFEELRAVAGKVADVGPRDLTAIDWDRAQLLYEAGRYAEALAHDDVALPRCVATSGPRDEVCRRISLSRARTLIRLGLNELLASERASVEAMAEEQTSPSLQVEAAQVLLRIESTRGTSAAHRTVFEQVRAFGESGPEVRVHPLRKVRALLVLAETSLATGEPAAARRWAEHALDRWQSLHDTSDAGALVRAEAASLVGISLFCLGENDMASKWLQRAQSEFSRLLGAEHPTTQFAVLNVALSLEGQGHTKEALALVTRAQALLRRSLGDKVPTYGRVQRFSERLSRAAGLDSGSASDSPSSRLAAAGSPGAIEFFN